MIQFIHQAIWFVILLLTQVLVLERVHISGYATPVLYIYFILMQKTEVSCKALMLQAFFLGICVDMFNNTPGMNAAACTFLAFIRNGLLRMQTVRGMSEVYEPSVRSMGTAPFVRYIVSGVFLHIFFLHSVDMFSLLRLGELFLKVLSDTLITVICIMCLDMMRRKN